MIRQFVIACTLATPVWASEDIADQYPQSVLYSKPVEYIPGVYSAIGATAPPTYENSGHNNNLSFIVTGEGVVVVNGGAAYVLAEALHKEIQAITDQPVKLVFNENGQGHAMLGNGYWSELGVPIIAHADAAAEFDEYGAQILDGMHRYNKDKAEGTFLAGPTETFDDEYVVELGEFRIEAKYLGLRTALAISRSGCPTKASSLPVTWRFTSVCCRSFRKPIPQIGWRLGTTNSKPLRPPMSPPAMVIQPT